MMNRDALPLITSSRLVADLGALGVRSGSVLMLHASVRAVGWVVGGPDVVLHALREVLGPGGTLSMYVGWADGTYALSSWPKERQRAYLEECPPFDPATSRAVREWSVLTEYLRTTPGACRSAHPEASVAAVGARAEWLTRDHPLQFGFGPGSPFERVVEARGDVLLLGSAIASVSLLHYSEHFVDLPGKGTVRYRAPMLVAGERRWVDLEELDTSGILPWHGVDYFADLVDAYVARGRARCGVVGAAPSYLLDAADLHAFAVPWMEENLGAMALCAQNCP
jgi:aminoglycoside 3-N-acetyltransferase